MIYFDMDGVLAKWNNQASVEDTYEPGYFLERELEESLPTLMQLLTESGHEVAILSAAYQEGTAKKDKRQWLKNHGLEKYPAVFVPYGHKKHLYVSEPKKGRHVLIDDFSKNLREWESVGNIGVKFFNDINGTKGTWDGYTISHKQSPEKMFVVVKAIADAAEMI